MPAEFTLKVRGRELDCEFKEFPVAFVNAIRRIVLAEIPIVLPSDIQILKNTSQLPYEMLKHRLQMLPISVLPSNATAIRDGKVEMHIKADKDMTLTTDDFACSGGASIMRDVDFDVPLVFLHLRKNEHVDIKFGLALELQPIDCKQVCNVSTHWKVDPELADHNRKVFVENGGDVRHFNNFEIQKSFSRDTRGSPNWTAMHIESVGVMPVKEIFTTALVVLRRKLESYIKNALENIRRQGDDVYEVVLQEGGHTLGYLLQSVIYADMNVNFVSYDIPHPLRSDMVLKFNTKKTPETILRSAKDSVEDYCSIIERQWQSS